MSERPPVTLLEIEDLTVRRGGREVLRVDRLDIPAGQVTAVIGPNGAGKSSLLLALAGLVPLASGQVRLRGQPVQPASLDYRRRLGLVLQDPLLLSVSVFSNVATGLRLRGMGRGEVEQRVAAALERLGISHLRRRQARSLSGGEAQRASLARALALEPDLLLLDEPFSALDAPTRARLSADLGILLRAGGQTAVFITHDLNEALLLGDRVAVILDGILRQSGAPVEVFNRPASGEVAAFVGVETLLPGHVEAIHDELALVRVEDRLLEAVGDVRVGQAVLVGVRPEDVTLMREAGPQTSARNHLAGRVARLSPSGPLERVVVDCGLASGPLVALVTRRSCEEMGLAEGVAVWASFKVSALHLIAR